MKDKKDTLAAQVIDILTALAQVGIRRPSVQGFKALSPDASLRVLNLTSPKIFKRIIKIQLQRAKAVELERRANYTEALKTARKAAKAASFLDIPSIEIASTTQAGNLLRRIGRLKEADETLVRSLEITNSAGITLFDSWIHYELAYIAYLKGNLNKACDFFIKSVDSAKEEDDALGQVAGLTLLAQQYYLNGDVDEALKFLNEAERVMEANSNKQEADWVERWKANVFIHRSIVEKLKGNYSESKSLFRKGEKIVNSLFTELAGKTTLLHRFGALALSMGDTQTAISKLSSSLRIYESSGRLKSTESGAEIVALLGKAYLLAGNKQYARKNLQRAIRLPADYANRRGHAWAHIELARLSIEKGNNTIARKHIEKALRVTSQHYRPEQSEAKSILKGLM